MKFLLCHFNDIPRAAPPPTPLQSFICFYYNTIHKCCTDLSVFICSFFCVCFFPCYKDIGLFAVQKYRVRIEIEREKIAFEKNKGTRCRAQTV